MFDTFTTWLIDFLEMTGFDEIQPLREMANSIDAYVVIMIMVLIIVIGVLLCFLGYRSFTVWCGFIGLLMGAFAGVIAVAALIPSTAEYSGVISVFFIICLGILGAFIAYRGEVFGAFLYSFVTMFILCYLPLSTIAEPNIIAAIVGLCVGVAAGVVAVIFKRISIISITCLSGAMGISLGLMVLMEGTNAFLSTVLPIIAGLGCAGGGFFVQLATTKDKPKDKTAETAAMAAAAAAAATAAVAAATGTIPAAGNAAAGTPAAETQAAAPAASQTTAAQAPAATENAAAQETATAATPQAADAPAEAAPSDTSGQDTANNESEKSE